MSARWSGFCDRCGHTFPAGTDVVLRHGSYIHATCAPGGDDER